jgi:hypothetical protein
MVGHPGLRIFGSDSRDQLGRVGIARHNRSTSGLPNPERLISVDEGNAVLLSYSAVALYAVLVEDGPDISAEMYFITGKQGGRIAPQGKPADYKGSSQNEYQSPGSEHGSAQHNPHIM